MKKLLTYWAAAAVILLSGCASTISSQVTTFHEWPTDMKEKTYALEAAPGQEMNPEYNHYAELLRSKLLSQGFIESKDSGNSTLKVTMEYGTLLTDMQLSSPYWSLNNDPFWQMHYSRVYRRSGIFYPYYFGRPGSFYAAPEVSAVRYFLHQLAVTITDRKSGKKLANIKVSSEQANPEISMSMPYLLESAFIEFPGQNGRTSNIELPVSK